MTNAWDDLDGAGIGITAYTQTGDVMITNIGVQGGGSDEAVMFFATEGSTSVIGESIEIGNLVGPIQVNAAMSGNDISLFASDFEIYDDINALEGTIALETSNSLLFSDLDTPHPPSTALIRSNELEFLNSDRAVFSGAGIYFQTSTDFTGFDTLLLRSVSDSAGAVLDVTQASNAFVSANSLGIEIGRMIGGGDPGDVDMTESNVVNVLAVDSSEGAAAGVGLVNFYNGDDLIIGWVNPVGVTA